MKVVAVLILISFISNASYVTNFENLTSNSFLYPKTNLYPVYGTGGYYHFEQTTPISDLYNFYNYDYLPFFNHYTFPYFQFSYDPYIFDLSSPLYGNQFTLAEGIIDTNSFIAIDKTMFNKNSLSDYKEYEYYIPVTKFSSSNDDKGKRVFVSSKDLLDTNTTKSPTPVENKTISKKLSVDNHIIRKIAKPVNFYFERNNREHKIIESNGFIVKDNSKLPYIDISKDGNKYEYSDVYYCNTKEKLQRFHNGDKDVCEFGRISSLLTQKSDYFEDVKNHNEHCVKENSLDSLKEIKVKLKTPDDELFDELLFSFKQKFSPSRLNIFKKNLANKDNVAKGYPHKSITLEDLIRHVIKVSKNYNIDPKLVLSIIEQESSFTPSAIGGDGEIGLMQITPDNAGAHVAQDRNIKNFNKDILYDPKTNILFGVHYLFIQIKAFDGNIQAAITAYNWGAKGTRGLNKRTGSFSSNYSSSVINRYSAFQTGSELFIASKKKDNGKG